MKNALSRQAGFKALKCLQSIPAVGFHSELLAVPSVVYTKYSSVRQDISLFYLNMPKLRENIQIQIKYGISGSRGQPLG